MSTESVSTARPPRPGQILLDLRLEADLTQVELGALAGVRGETVSDAENGRRPSPRTQHRLAVALAEKLGRPLSRQGVFPEWQEASA